MSVIASTDTSNRGASAEPTTHDADHGPSGMLSVAQAREYLLAAADSNRKLRDSHEVLPTIAAHGRVLANDLASQLNVPPMDNSQMDGYAVRAADCACGTARLKVTQRIPAGHVGTDLLPGTAARIFTGAMIPPGADAIVMQESCIAEHTDQGDFVMVDHLPEKGDWIRRAGEDIRAGAIILAAGTRLRAQELGLAASVGLASLTVVRRLRIAVFYTGNELVMPGEPLGPGAIYNSNRFMLRGMLDAAGCELTDFGIVPDTLEATRVTLRAAAEAHDVIVTCGGVSVGEEDHIRPAVEAEGKLTMWQIAVKPGKPLAFGQIRRRPDTGGASAASAGEAFFLGLPGNPVSSFVTFLLFVRPFLLRLQGVHAVLPRAFPLRADFAWPKADRRNEFLRAKRNAAGGLDLFSNQGSGVLTSTVWGDGLVDNPAGTTIVPGDIVQFLPFSVLQD